MRLTCCQWFHAATGRQSCYIKVTQHVTSRSFSAYFIAELIIIGKLFIV